ELSEEVMLGAVVFAHEQSKVVIDAIIDLAEKAAKDPWDLHESDDSALKSQVKSLIGAGIAEAYKLTGKADRVAAIAAAKAPMKEAFADADPETRLKAAKLGKKV